MGDERLNKRARTLMDRFSSKPTASIPMACNGWSETIATYRFLGNEAVDWRDIMAPHYAQTRQRMRAHAVVLCLQDTTELDFNGQDIIGLGPLRYEAQRGMYLHPTYAITPQREPLGVTDAWMWARQPKDADGHRPGPKESLRWIEGYKRVAEMAADVPDTRLVYVADRESDIVELMQCAQDMGTPADWLVRAKHNRCLPEGQKLWSHTCAGEPLGEIVFTMPSRQGQKARPVRQPLWARRLETPAGKTAPVEVTCIVACEVGAPAGTTPVQWRLLTNRAAPTLDAVIELIDWYRARWEIEMFFHVLKNGCCIEALQLSGVDRLERALALFMVVAWRIAHLMRTGRTCPDLDAALFFDPDEIRGAFLLTKKKPPKRPPRINEVLRLIATLGGFLARKGDGEPGVKTIWLGLQRVRDAATTLQALRDESL
ncbi:MAG: IS4 family transposase [Propionivibrio sp.]|nr:IS4 family transposase [Propionivibrio sp.]